MMTKRRADLIVKLGGMMQRLGERGRHQPFDGTSRLCTSAAKLMIEAIDELTSGGQEYEIPGEPEGGAH